MTTTRMARLGDVCKQDRHTITPNAAIGLRYIGLETIESGTGQFVDGELSKTPDVPKANSFRFGMEHVLYGKLRPYLNKVALPDFEGKCSTEIVPLLPSPDLDRAYLSYFLRTPCVVAQISGKTAGAQMPRADMAFVLGLHIRLPSLNEQRRIVDLLSRAEGIVRLRREAKRKWSEVIPALFGKMFGDPTANVRAWPTARLGDIAEVVSGITKGRKLNEKRTNTVPYLRVANVQAGYIDLSELKQIDALPEEVAQLALRTGDVVLTEGGDHDKLGRGAMWEYDVPNCIHQNHIFRVRLREHAVSPTFFVTYLQTNAARSYFLRSAKRTTNLASINMTQLRDLPVPVPSRAIQETFEVHFRNVRSIETQQGAAAELANATFEALLARTFDDHRRQSSRVPSLVE